MTPGRRIRSRSVLLLSILGLAMLPACGGGSGGGGRRAHAAKLELGTVGLAAPTRVQVAFANPTDRPANVTVIGTKGPFTIDPADLPGACGGGGEVSLGVICSAGITGDVKGSITLGFEDGGRTRKKKWKVVAWCEPPDFEVLDTDVDFGGVFLGYSGEQTIRVENRSGKSPIGITDVVFPAPEFTLADTTLPLIVPPGGTGEIGVRFTPSAEGPLSGDLVVRTPDASDPRTVTVRATGRVLGMEVVTDYGEQSLDTAGNTPILSVDVPDDAFSLSLEGRGVPGDVIGLDTLTGAGGYVYENTNSTGQFQWISKVRPPSPPWMWTGAFLTKLPNTDRLNVQLVRGGGTYTFSLRRSSGVSSKIRVRAFVERRAPEVRQAGILDLNVFLGVGTGVTAATAAESSGLQEALSQAEYELSLGGLRIGDIRYYDVPDSVPDTITVADIGTLMMSSAVASEVRLNVFLLYDLRLTTGSWGSVIGLSPSVPGPKCNGTELSGVFARFGVPYFDTGESGHIIAHEIGHYLGLWHVTEPDGTPDIIDDTPLVYVTPADDNLMWSGNHRSSGLTAGQMKVMLGHPFVRTDPDALAKPLRVKRPARTFDPSELPQGWCGSCGK